MTRVDVGRPGPSAKSRPAWRTALAPQNAGVYYACALLVLVFVVASMATGKPAYLSTTNTANVLDQTAQIGILAIFMTVVLVSGNFDLSVAATAALCGGVATAMVDGSGVYAGIIVAIAVGVTVGLVNGFLVELVGVNAFIVTLGTMTAVRGVLLVATGGESIQGTSPDLGDLVTGSVDVNLQVAAVAVGVVVIALAVLRALRDGGRSPSPVALITGGVLVVLGVVILPSAWPMTRQLMLMVALGVAAWAVLRWTIVGRRLYAVGGNDEAARLAGIGVRRYRMVPFMLTGFGAALTGIVFAGNFGSVSPTSLQGMELTVLAAAILGGTSLFGGVGSIVKSLTGALILTVLANGFSVLNLGANYQQMIQGVVIVGAAATYAVAERRARTSGGRKGPTSADDADPPRNTADAVLAEPVR